VVAVFVAYKQAQRAHGAETGLLHALHVFATAEARVEEDALPVMFHDKSVSAGTGGENAQVQGATTM
jgi:hypothetical protein